MLGLGLEIVSEGPVGQVPVSGDPGDKIEGDSGFFQLRVYATFERNWPGCFVGDSPGPMLQRPGENLQLVLVILTEA